MTATAVRESTRVPAGRSPGTVLAGTWTLVRLILRRDRIKLPAWLLGITVLLFYFATVLQEVARSDQQREDMKRFMEGAVGGLFGPGYGRDAITPELYTVGVYGQWFFVLAALMSLLLVWRHTRLDEQQGRAALIRANVVGRHAQLTAVLVVAVAANVLLALMLGGAMAAKGYDVGEGLLFGAGYGLFVALFGPILDLPQWARNLLPLQHTGQPPLDDIAWSAAIVLLVVAAGLAAAGLAGFGRRDLEGR